MEAKKNSPEIRFKGFEGEWEESKLSEMTDYKNGRGHEDKQGTSGKYELINLNSISIDGGLKNSGKFIDESDTTLLENDLVMVLSDVGHGDLLGRVALIPENNKYVLNQRVALLRPNNTVNPLFLFVNINAHQNYFKSQGAGMSQLNISKSSVEDFISFVPTLPEQTQIGTYFQNLDSLISLHQRKYDKLLTVKKAMLEKMFPKEGADVPEIRFKGFEGKWEKKNLSQIIDLRGGKDYKHLSNGNIPVYGTGGYMLSVNEALSYKEDAIGIGRKGTIDKPYILRAPFWTVDTLFYAIPKEKNDLQFIFDVFQRINWKQKDESTGVPSLSKVAINGISILTPKYKEQNKIGTFFQNLDTLITQHQKELEKLNNLKKACLEKMFV